MNADISKIYKMVITLQQEKTNNLLGTRKKILCTVTVLEKKVLL